MSHMAWSWRTSPDGYIEVDTSGGTNYVRIALPGPNAQTAATEQWLELAKKYAQQNNIPVWWVLAFIYSESGGNPNVSNFCCAGLMALMLSVYHLTLAQAQDPETNVSLGTKTIGDYAKRGFDLPTIASMYNAGPAAGGGGAKKSISSVWGMVENMPAVPWTGYIEKIVRAANFWHDRLQGISPSPQREKPGTLLPSPTEVAAILFGIGAGWLVGDAIGAWAASRSRG